MDNKEKKKKGIDEMSEEEKMNEYLRIEREHRRIARQSSSNLTTLIIAVLTLMAIIAILAVAKAYW